MKKSFGLLIFIFCLIASLPARSAEPVKFSEDNTKMKNDLMQYVPIGSSGTEASDKITKIDCKCEPLNTNKPVKDINDADSLWCVHTAGFLVQRKWQIILALDENKKVKDISVTTGLVGP